MSAPARVSFSAGRMPPGPLPQPFVPEPPAGFPDASTTGVQPGTILTPWGGGQDLDGSTTYENLLFPIATGDTPYYTVGAGSGAVFRNCQFQWDASGDGGGLSLDQSDNSLIEYCTLTAIALTQVDTCTVYACNLQQTSDDFLHVTSDGDTPGTGCANITIDANYIHNPNPSDTAHTDGLQTLGVTGLTVTGNTFDPGWVVRPDDPINSCIYLENIFDGTTGPIVISGNWLNGGGFCLQFQAVTDTGGFQFTNNLFGQNAEFGLFSVYAGGLPTYQAGNFDSGGNPVTLVVNS
jgi:Right handed beta helix region